MRYYVLIKRKGASKWLGAIPAKKGVSLAKLRKSIKAGSKRFVYKIVSETQLKKYIMRLKPRKTRKRSSKGKKRRKTRSRKGKRRKSSSKRRKRRKMPKSRMKKSKYRRKKPMKKRKMRRKSSKSKSRKKRRS